MKKGFTLLELVVVIIILGILATLGLTQYGRMIERSRGAEARAAMGDIRKFALAYFMEYGNANMGSLTTTPAEVGIGTANDQIPSGCRPSHYFSYTIAANNASSTVTATATRCGATGKPPAGPTTNPTLTLTSVVDTGVDTWGGTGEY